ncbi:hypothetical protein ElyMa_005597000 [Elysia marginata]|uniref:Uncharacterized protein n=1 Tax=Elysia marginata TaxID=1093978 RepID=A0AAV4F451_9GAST|nr:hypothetical protein ElyMa_005597000 [Elysia marginata]
MKTVTAHIDKAVVPRAAARSGAVAFFRIQTTFFPKAVSAADIDDADDDDGDIDDDDDDDDDDQDDVYDVDGDDDDDNNNNQTHPHLGLLINRRVKQRSLCGVETILSESQAAKSELVKVQPRKVFSLWSPLAASPTCSGWLMVKLGSARKIWESFPPHTEQLLNHELLLARSLWAS